MFLIGSDEVLVDCGYCTRAITGSRRWDPVLGFLHDRCFFWAKGLQIPWQKAKKKKR